MTGRMQVRQEVGPFGPEWVVTCPEHGEITWVWICDMPGCLDHRNAMNHAIGHFRDEHEYPCPACYGNGYHGGMRSFIEGRIRRTPCDECGGTGTIVRMGEPSSPPTKSALSKENRA